MAADLIARNVTVSGRVQGVAFRAWTKSEAARLGLSGWVRNEPDGTVSAVLEGEADQVNTMLDAMKSGPTVARVDTVAAVPCQVTGAQSFEILRDRTEGH